MTVRELTVVGLRLVAVWLIVATLALLPTLVYGLLHLISLGGPSGISVWMGVGGPLLIGATRLALGVALFAFANPLAGVLFRDLSEGPDAGKIESIHAGQLYHVATFLMGIYVLVQAVEPGSRALVALVDESPGEYYAAPLVQCVLLLVLAVALIFGAKGLARFCSSLGHDPDNVPAQQFSIRVILVVVVGIAILLGVIQAIVR